MKTNEITILNGLNMALSNLVSVDQLSDEALSQLIALSLNLGQWLHAAGNEAVDRAKNGTCFDGYVVKDITRRKIADEEGATNALLAFNPALLPLCQKTTLAGIRDIKSVLGKDRFESIIGPHLETRTWSKLVPSKSAV